MKQLCQLFDTVVRPTLEYGVELWGPSFLASAAGECGAAEKFQRNVVKSTLGLNSRVPNVVVLAEVGRYPLRCAWGKMIFGFWKRVMNLPQSRVSVTAAVRDNIQLSQQGSACWAAKVMAFLQSIGVENGVDEPMPWVPASLAEGVLQQRYLEAFRSATGTKVEFYRNAILGGEILRANYQMQPYLGTVLSLVQRVALARFRCSSHKLGVEVGRYVRRARELRTCRLCGGGGIEDEHHIVFQCPHSGLQQVRSDYSELFGSNIESLRDFLQQSPSYKVASCVKAFFDAGGFESLSLWT